jgi:hypothetical protein
MLSRLELKEPTIARLTGASGHQTVIARVEIEGTPLNVVATQLLRPYFGEQQIGEFRALSRAMPRSPRSRPCPTTLDPTIEDLSQRLRLCLRVINAGKGRS